MSFGFVNVADRAVVHARVGRGRHHRGERLAYEWFWWATNSSISWLTLLFYLFVLRFLPRLPFGRQLVLQRGLEAQLDEMDLIVLVDDRSSSVSLPEVPLLSEMAATWLRTGDPGRDGCRIPIPWGGDRPPYRFGPGTGQPWLPQPMLRRSSLQAWQRPGMLRLSVRLLQPPLSTRSLTFRRIGRR